MGFAEEKVKEYIRKNYHRFHNIHLNQLLDFLPCLTPADMQQIRRNTDRHGDILSVAEFFSHLWCRTGWVGELITALKNTNSELADVIREVYQEAQAPSVPARSPSSAPSSSAHSSNDPPHNQPRPTGQALCTAAPSASLPDVVDCKPPVQESKFPSLDAKTCRNDIKQQVPTPARCNTNAPDSDASLAVQRTNPASVQPASPNSLVQHQAPLGEMSEEEVQSSTPSKSDTGPSVRETPQTTASLRQSPSKSSHLPQRLLRKEPFGHVPTTRFQPPPSDFSGSSSMDVIPPSSPTAVSATLSDGHLEGPKPPVWERDPQGADLWTPSKKMMGDVPPRAPSSVSDSPANSSKNRNKASSPSRGANVFLSNREEDDVSPLKPGVLASGEITGGPLDQQLINLGAEYSGTSARFRFSHRSSGESDPLMLSSSTQGTSAEDSERNTSAGTNHATHRHWNDNHSDGGSIETHTGHIEESPSVDLMGAPEAIGLALRNASQPSGDFPDSSAGGQRIQSASPRSVCNDGERNSHQNKRARDKAPSIRSERKLLALGFALTSLAAVAFVLYKKLKK